MVVGIPGRRSGWQKLDEDVRCARVVAEDQSVD